MSAVAVAQDELQSSRYPPRSLTGDLFCNLLIRKPENVRILQIKGAFECDKSTSLFLIIQRSQRAGGWEKQTIKVTRYEGSIEHWRWRPCISQSVFLSVPRSLRIDCMYEFIHEYNEMMLKSGGCVAAL